MIACYSPHYCPGGFNKVYKCNCILCENENLIYKQSFNHEYCVKDHTNKILTVQQKKGDYLKELLVDKKFLAITRKRNPAKISKFCMFTLIRLLTTMLINIILVYCVEKYSKWW